MRSQPIEIGTGGSPGSRLKVAAVSVLVVGSLAVFAIPVPPPADPVRETIDVTSVIARLRDPEPGARIEAAKYLGLVGTGAHEIVPGLVASLEDPHPGVRAAAAAALAAMGPSAATAGALEALARGTVDTDPATRLQMIRALGVAGREVDDAVPPLARALSDSAPAVRAEAARLLGMMRVRARSALPALEALVSREGDAAVSQAAIEAMGRIRG